MSPSFFEVDAGLASKKDFIGSIVHVTPIMQVSVVAAVLGIISVIGAIAIPFGNPAFLDRAIALEGVFIALTVLTLAGYKKQLYFCIPLGVIVMIGNSLAPPHVEIMTTFSKPFNAIILIVGGYVLQVALIVATIMKLREERKNKSLKKIVAKKDR